MSATQATAANRFGLGARPGELDRQGDGRERLLAQLRPSPQALSQFQGLPDSDTLLVREYALQRAPRVNGAKKDAAAMPPDAAMSPGGSERAAGDRAAGKTSAAARPAGSPASAKPARRSDAEAPPDSYEGMQRALRQQQLAEFAARYRHAAVTSTPFVERLVHFWSNHFAVSIDKGNARLYAAPMEREAIRPHVLGRFEEMLLAVETHPAMLRYLDNVLSIGNDSATAQRMADKGKDKRGLNENLAREILELHTLGVKGGYQQADVTELARAITGWTIRGPREVLNGGGSAFLFRASSHEPGTRRVVGRTYAEGGVEQGRRILADLARHPSTAQHLSFKLARHFVADDPPPALVKRMAAAYLAADGDLSALYRAMIQSEEAWSASARKFKTPNDFVISALRAGDIAIGDDARSVLNLLSNLGQPVFTPRSPAGFPDTAADWGSADALWKRVQAAQMLSARVDPTSATPYDRAVAVLGAPVVNGDFASALRRAGSPRDGYSLLFASPAFQWRA